MCCLPLSFRGKLSCPYPISIFSFSQLWQGSFTVQIQSCRQNISGSSACLDVSKRIKCGLGLHHGTSIVLPLKGLQSSCDQQCPRNVVSMQFFLTAVSNLLNNIITWNSQLIGNYLDSLRKKLLPKSSQAHPWEGNGPGSTAEGEHLSAFCIWLH